MIYRIAFASSDGNGVDRHFGHADTFYIYELDSETGNFGFSESVGVAPPCSGGEHEIPDFETVVERLGGVSAVFAKRVGFGASNYLESRGIAVYQAPFLIDDVLDTVIKEKRWEEDKWLSHTKN